MTADEQRLKEIKHRKYELTIAIRDIKKELIRLSSEEAMINGYHRIERTKKCYKKAKKNIKINRRGKDDINN